MTYRQKNRLLWVGAVILLILSWLLSFSKTYQEIRDYRRADTYNLSIQQEHIDRYAIQRKLERQDSLLAHFRMDSVAFSDYFLQNVSLCLEGLPVQIVYEGYGQQQTSNNGILSQEINLLGQYQEVIRAIARLEREFYVRSVRYEKERYTLNLGIVSKD